MEKEAKEQFQEIRDILKNLAVSRKESEIKSEKEFQEIRDLQKESEKDFQEIRELQKESEKDFQEIRELQKESEKDFQEIRELLKETNKNLGGLSNTIGDSLEQSYFKSINLNKIDGKILFDSVKYDSIELNKDILFEKENTYKSKEVDILLLNGKTIGVFEIKSKPDIKDLYNFKNSMFVFKDKEIKLYLGFSCLDKKKMKKNKDFKKDFIETSKKLNIKLLTLKNDIIEFIE